MKICGKIEKAEHLPAENLIFMTKYKFRFKLNKRLILHMREHAAFKQKMVTYRLKANPKVVAYKEPCNTLNRISPPSRNFFKQCATP